MCGAYVLSFVPDSLLGDVLSWFQRVEFTISCCTRGIEDSGLGVASQSWVRNGIRRTWKLWSFNRVHNSNIT